MSSSRSLLVRAVVLVALLVWLPLTACRAPQGGPPVSSSLGSAVVGAPPEPGAALPAVEPSSGLRVLATYPSGTGFEGRRVWVEFDRQVGALGAEDAVPLSLTLEPAVPGKFRWEAPEQLTFEAEQPLPLATAFTVRLREGGALPDGSRLAEPVSWSFETRRPEVEFWNHPSRDRGEGQRARPWTQQFVLRPVGASVDELRRHVTVTVSTAGAGPGARPTPVPFKWESTERHATVSPLDHWPPGAVVTLTVDGDLRGSEGPLPMGRPASGSFSVQKGLTVTSVECREAATGGCGPRGYELHFSAAIPEAEVEKLRVEPRPGRASGCGVGTSGERALVPAFCIGDLVPGTPYRVTVPAGVVDAHGQRSREPAEFQLVAVAPDPTLWLAASRGTLEATKRVTIGLETARVSRARLRAAVLGDEEYLRLVKLLRSGPEPQEAQEPLSLGPWPLARPPSIERELRLDVDSSAYAWASKELELTELLGARHGALLVEVAPLELVPGEARPLPPLRRGLFQITDLGVAVRGGVPRTALHAVSLSTLRARPGLEVKELGPLGERRLGVTGADGLLVFASTEVDQQRWLRVREPQSGDRLLVSLEPEDSGYAFESEEPSGEETETRQASALEPHERAVVSLWTDRVLYEPGETVEVAGWSGIETPFVELGMRPVPPGTEVRYALVEGKRVVDEVKTRTTEGGRHSSSLRLPPEGAGRFFVRASLLGAETRSYFSVEAFDKPAFSLEATLVGRDFHAADRLPVSLVAKHYYGAPAELASVRVRRDCEPAHYSVPGLAEGWEQVAFKRWDRDDARDEWRLPIEADVPPGTASLEVPPVAEHAWPLHCAVSVAAEDRLQRNATAALAYWIHPRHTLVYRLSETRVGPGGSVEIGVRAVDYRGRRVAVRDVSLSVARRSWVPIFVTHDDGNREQSGSVERWSHVPACTLNPAAAGRDASCRLSGLAVGEYEVTFAGLPGQWPARFSVEKHEVIRDEPEPKPLVLSREAVEVGGRLSATVALEERRSDGALLRWHGGLAEALPISVRNGKSQVVLVPSDAWTGENELTLLSPVRTREEEDYYGHYYETPIHLTQTWDEAVFSVSTKHRELKVTLEHPEQAVPGAALEVGLQVTDARGAPVAGHALVWAVDEAVLSLRDDWPPSSLLADFAARRRQPRWLGDGYHELLWPYVTRARDSLRGFGIGSAFGGGEGIGLGFAGMSQGAAERAPRDNFKNTAFFVADVALGADGRGKVEVSLPSNLTTFRVRAIASTSLEGAEAPGRFGHAEGRIEATLPVLLSAAFPPLLRPGDTTELSALVHNRTDRAGAATVRVVVDGAPVFVEGDVEQRVPLAAGELRRVAFPLRAGGAGEGTVELALDFVSSDGARFHDAERRPLEVRFERLRRERATTYGTLTSAEPAVTRLGAPLAVQGSLELSYTAETSLLGELAGGLDYLLHYPYGCLEQTTSGLLPALLVGTAPWSPITEASARERLARAEQRLRSMQTASGGFAYWPGDSAPRPFASAYASAVLVELRSRGAAVDATLLERSLDYLEVVLGTREPEESRWERRSDLERLIERRAPRVEPVADRAMAAFALSRAGRAVPSKVLEELLSARSEQSLFIRAVLVRTLLRVSPRDPRLPDFTAELLQGVDRAGALAFSVERAHHALRTFDSPERDSAVLVSALVELAPEHPRLPELLRGLLARRNPAGHWGSTQANAFALLALSDVARQLERDPSPVAVGASLDGVALPRAELTSSAPRFFWQGPLSAPPGALTLLREGTPRVYTSVSLSWVPAEFRAVAKGISVRRTLRTETRDGVTSLALGEPVAFDVELDTSVARNDVVVDVPLPSGLTGWNPNLGAGGAALAFAPLSARGLTRVERLRDRVLLFFDTLPAGKRTQTLFAVASARGDYELPPAHAELMNYPEVFGRSETARFRVE